MIEQLPGYYVRALNEDGTIRETGLLRFKWHATREDAQKTADKYSGAPAGDFRKFTVIRVEAPKS